MHHQYSSSVSPFQANTGVPAGRSAVPVGPTTTAAAASSWVEKMLQDTQRTSAPSATSVSMSTAVCTVMCSEPATRAPRRGCAAAYSRRIAIRPGISCSARRIWCRPKAARDRSATANSTPPAVVSALCGLVACCGLVGLIRFPSRLASLPASLERFPGGRHAGRGYLTGKCKNVRMSGVPLRLRISGKRRNGSGLSPRMLRYREALGLLPRNVSRPSGEHRQYTADDLAAVVLALQLERRYEVSPAALAFGLRVLAEPEGGGSGTRPRAAVGPALATRPDGVDFEKQRAQRWLNGG